MVFGCIPISDRRDVHGEGGVLEIRSARRGAKTNDKRGAGGSVFDLHELTGGHENVNDCVRDDRHKIRQAEERESEAVRMIADNEAAVAWVKRC